MFSGSRDPDSDQTSGDIWFQLCYRPCVSTSFVQTLYLDSIRMKDDECT